MSKIHFVRYAWGVLAYNLAVILWGAYVRATNSGAGCGGHWPDCHGAVVPRDPSAATLIEYSHRLSTGLALLSVLLLALWAVRAHARGNAVRRWAIASLALILVEAMLGAGLVLFGLVGENSSMARAGAIALHLCNTLLLVGALSMTAWRATFGGAFRPKGRCGSVLVLLSGTVGIFLLGATGAVTALGDTLFKSASLTEAIGRDFEPAAHLFVRLRLLHPPLAMAVGAFLGIAAASLARKRRGAGRLRTLAALVSTIVALQMVVGMVNLGLMAPVALQLLHLLLANGVWLSWLLMGAALLEQARPAWREESTTESSDARAPGFALGRL